MNENRTSTSPVLPLLDTRGPVLRPGDTGYDEERQGFQTAYAHRPVLAVGAEHADDVRAAVRYAAAHGLGVAVQSTGHGLAAASDGGVLVSTGRMKGLRIDPAARTARAEAGVVWAEVIEAAAAHGLAPLNGSAPGVGVVGYLTGGGLGILGRQFGYAADRVRSFDLVTADGALRHVTADSEPELFWALRGGGAGFGVVTAVEFDLVPLAELYGGVLAFADEQVPGALAAYLRWTADLPEALTSSVALMTWPDAPFAPEAYRGRYVMAVRVAFTGSAAEGARLVAPLRELGPLFDDLRVLPYTESHTIHSDPPHPHPYDGDNALVTAVPEEALGALTGEGARAGAVVQIKHLGGAMGREPQVPNAVGFRGARYLVSVLSGLFELDRSGARALHADVLAPLAGVRLGRNRNHLFGDHGELVVRDAYEGGVLRRLGAVRLAYDPRGVFGPSAF
ncbi:FAD-binding oxidoreductase [Streptomyces cavernicola]|uniref:FAD-binding oxidoreductase n=1 Tax=Streptomyces cavernicola TaxID=3043613 RepID=A0ABT6SQD3_9ACTN|nr:FAD-binding oxidoreductase [Streptomyces sp. B-S-A6]MDI3409436.1 FAD-binding oxidoreductase [Streptomyces sp. B-S-A6]